MPSIHTCRYRVCYADTDRMGRVYYSNYLVICERARTEFLRDVGHSYKSIEERGCLFPVRSCQARYYNYAVYDDLLECRSYISRMRHATLVFATDIHRAGEDRPLVSAQVELACVDAGGKPRGVPPARREALAPDLGDDTTRT
jgi:acyl-CoA thioester hydrolase